MPSAKSTRIPSFQFYPSDFLSGDKVSRMSYTEIGIYIVLLSHAWLAHGLPTQTTEIAKMLKMNPQRFAKLWAGVLSEAFVTRGGRLVNIRQESERRKQNEFRARQAANGAKGGRPSGKGLGSSGLTHSKARALQTVDRSPVDVRSSEEGSGETETPMDVWARELVALYPAEGRCGWHLVERPLFAALTSIADEQRLTSQQAWVWLKSRLEQHKRSHQWRDKRMVKRLDRWLADGLYHAEPAEQASSPVVDAKVPAWAR